MVDRSNSTQLNTSVLSRRHLQFGWWSLLCFLTLGIMLEGFHGFKVGWYLKPAFETRRLMWTLGHAHGTLLALVNAVFGISLALAGDVRRAHRWASPCLMGANILLPGGFFLGGIYIYAGDPGIGIFLVPVGGAFLLVGVLLTAIASTKFRESVSAIGKHPDAVKKRSKNK